MYSLVLTNGNIINIVADVVQFDKIQGTIGFYNDLKLVARVNLDNIVGWINTRYKVEEVKL